MGLFSFFIIIFIIFFVFRLGKGFLDFFGLSVLIRFFIGRFFLWVFFRLRFIVELIFGRLIILLKGLWYFMLYILVVKFGRLLLYFKVKLYFFIERLLLYVVVFIFIFFKFCVKFCLVRIDFYILLIFFLVIWVFKILFEIFSFLRIGDLIFWGNFVIMFCFLCLFEEKYFVFLYF